MIQIILIAHFSAHICLKMKFIDMKRKDFINGTISSTTYLFFTGKGGVGKTSLACATAVQKADSGKVVLLVSTDPASNLMDVLESTVDENIKPIKGIRNLFAININPEDAAEEYRNRVTQPLEGIASKEEIKKIREDLSGACTTEIASFDEFSRFVSGETQGVKYDTIIFDTAPTGHTLRLLELPAAWSSFTEEMNQLGLELKNYSISASFLSAKGEISTKLGILEGKEVLELKRLRGDKDGPFVYFLSYFHPRAGLTGKEDFSQPLYEMLEENYATRAVIIVFHHFL